MKARKHGLVSIVVTNYNNEAYIKECLDSLRKQTYQEIELIIVDDCSSDNSRHLIRKWKHHYKHRLKHRILFVPLPRNVGFASAITVGMSLARGEFVAMQDGDDVSHRQRIEKQVAYLRQHPSIGLLGTNYESFHSVNPERRTKPSWLAFSREKIRRVYAAGGHCISHGTMIFRGRWFDKLGGPSRSAEGAEDYEMIAKCINHGCQVMNLQEVLYYYRMHSKQRSRKYYKK